VATLTPVFTLSIGSYRATAEVAVGGPRQILVERDMAIAADLLEVALMERAGVALGAAAALEQGGGLLGAAAGAAGDLPRAR
jgi:hypothetical protein